MRKILNVLLIFMYSVLSIFVIRYYNINILRQTLGQDRDQTMLNIKDVEKRDPKEIFNHVINCTKKYGLTVSYVRYDNLLPHQKQEISIYISDFDKLKNKIQLKQGRLLNENDESNKYISTVNNINDPDQVGVIKYFSKKVDIYIRPLKYRIENTNGLGLDVFYVNTRDTKIIRDLIKNLESKYKMRIYNFEDIDKSEILPNIYDLSIMVCVPYFLIFVILVYIIFLRYKELAVYKMFGIDNNRILLKVLLKELVIDHLRGILINLILSVIYILIFNSYYFIYEFFSLWIFYISIFTLSSLIVVSVPLIILLKFVEIPLMLKNKTPTNVSLSINCMFKFVSVLILISFMTKTIVVAVNLTDKMSSINNWEQNKCLAKVNVSSVWKHEVVDSDHIDFGDGNAHKFFIETNKKGGILIDVNNYKLTNEDLIGKPPYCIERSIDVNNNYLKINPIYDENGEIVDVPDHNDKTITLLVPQKFGIYSNEIKKIYSSSDVNENQKDDVVNVIYVKDNQSYFTYNLNIAQDTGYKIKDPIVQVISNNNSILGDTYYGCAMTHSYYVKVENIRDPFKDIKDDLIKTGYFDYVYSATTIYDMISNDIYRLKEQLITSSVMLILSFITIVVIIVSICTSYLDNYKLKSAILKMYGINFVLRYQLFYIGILLMWTVGIILTVIFKRANIKLEVTIYWICMVVDVMISSVFLRIYENKKISTVLKGE